MSLKDFLAFDSLLSDRTRLAIMATLTSSEEPIDFNTLLEQLDLTKGNLSSHMRKLEDAKLIKVSKRFIDRKPKTTYVASTRGSLELKNYLTQIQNVIEKVDE